MNRLALQESVAVDVPPADLVVVAGNAGFQSVGLRVAHSPAENHWGKGAAAPELLAMVDHLLTLRVSVLDVGTIELGADTEETTGHVLDLAGRLGARHVTASVAAGLGAEAGRELFGQLVRQGDAYQVVPLIVIRPGTAIDTPAAAIRIAGKAAGGCVLTVDTAQSALEIEAAVLEAGNRLGYLRVLVEELDLLTEEAAAGLLATVPVHVPVAVGSDRGRHTGAGELATSARRWASMIDIMLEHPRSRAFRLGTDRSGR